MINTSMINTSMINTSMINRRKSSPRRRFGRRTLLVGALATTALLAGSVPAHAATAQAGDLQFSVPASVRAMTPAAPWQWYGEQSGAAEPAVVVLARGDLHSDSPQELLTALFAPQLTGRLPQLELDTPQLSSDAETVQLRQPFSYVPAPGKPQSGTALIITDQGRAGILVVVGDPNVVTAGMVDSILSSARLLP